MAQILGLTDSNASSSYWSENARRQVFHQYPQGAAPLMGLLSLMGDEETDKPEFGWWEDRMDAHKSLTADGPGATGGPFGSDATTDEIDGFSAAAGDSLWIFVDDASQFRERDVVWVKGVTNTGGSVIDNLKGVVIEAPNTGSNYIKVRLLSALTNVNNDANQLDLDVFMIGSAVGEGDRSRTGGHSWPLEITNYTQIFRTAFSFTRTALKQGLRFDKTGVYKEKAKKNSLRHMTALEYATFFGDRAKANVTNDDGDTVVERKYGGFLWFLKQWELGTVGNGAAFNYRPGGSDITAANWETEENKRIITVNGTLTKDQFENLIERAFRKTNDEAFEKLVLCGSGFISVFNKAVDRNATVNRKLFDSGKAGISMTEWESPHGTVFFKSHPLFNEHSAFRNSAFIIDLGNLKYRPLSDSDTDLLKNRQNNDTDGRKDEWLTEAGLEIRFPESHMFIDNVTGITV